jgi:hypothetical protein
VVVVVLYSSSVHVSSSVSVTMLVEVVVVEDVVVVVLIGLASLLGLWGWKAKLGRRVGRFLWPPGPKGMLQEDVGATAELDGL